MIFIDPQHISNFFQEGNMGPSNKQKYWRCSKPDFKNIEKWNDSELVQFGEATKEQIWCCRFGPSESLHGDQAAVYMADFSVIYDDDLLNGMQLRNNTRQHEIQSMVCLVC